MPEITSEALPRGPEVTTRQLKPGTTDALASGRRRAFSPCFMCACGVCMIRCTVRSCCHTVRVFVHVCLCSHTACVFVHLCPCSHTACVFVHVCPCSHTARVFGYTHPTEKKPDRKAELVQPDCARHVRGNLTQKRILVHRFCRLGSEFVGRELWLQQDPWQRVGCEG